MANQQHLNTLKQGVEAWNKWRKEHPEIQQPDLSGEHLEGVELDWEVQLGGANFSGACLENAKLWGAHLEEAILSEAHLKGIWLLRAHLEGADFNKANLEKAALTSAHAENASFLDAYLKDADLRSAHLEGALFARAHLENAQLSMAHLEGAYIHEESHLEGANLSMAHLEEANLFGSHFESANLSGTRLEGADLRQTHLEGADLRRASFSNTTQLDDATFSSERYRPTLLADVSWNGVNLSVVDWTRVKMLGDEHVARQEMKAHGQPQDYWWSAAVRANRQLAVALRGQGLNEEADYFSYRAQQLQRAIWLRQGRPLKYAFSWFLYLLAGYGYRPLRSLIIYLLVIIGFAVGYYEVTHILHAQPYPLAWYEALILSVSSFHGRGFFQPVQSLGDPVPTGCATS